MYDESAPNSEVVFYIFIDISGDSQSFWHDSWVEIDGSEEW